MTSLDDVAAIAADEHHLAVVSTLRADSTIQTSVVNAGILAHPATGRPALPSSPTAGSSWPTSAPARR